MLRRLALPTSHQNATAARANHASHANAAGFTLVELLVVMAIIGVLIALLIPVIGAARRSAQKAAIATEIQGLAQALQAFKTQYQVDFPPDFVNENPALVSTLRLPPSYPIEKGRIDQYMSRLFRYRQPDADHFFTLTQPAQVTQGIQRLQALDPAESLVFWLSGFTSDPARPLFGPGERSPFFAFDKARLLDRDNDGFFEYYPRGSKEPYIYLVHYNYITGFTWNEQTYHQPAPGASSQIINLPCPRPYLARRDPTAQVNANYPTIKTNYAAADSFQIICAGLDGEFGQQVQNNPNQFRAYGFPAGPYDKQHLDNIVSFGQGSLEDSMP